LKGVTVHKRTETKSMGLIIWSGGKRPFNFSLNWALIYAGSVTATVIICLVLNFMFVLYPSRMSEYNLLVAGGTSHLTQLFEQQIAYTKAEIRRGEENIGWLTDVAKDLETKTNTIRNTLQMKPASISYDDLNKASTNAGFAATIDPQQRAMELGLKIKELVAQADITLNTVAEDARQSKNTLWFQNHTPNRWPVPDPFLFRRAGEPGRRDLTPGFGNRISPISGWAEYHTGIDVDGTLGEPIYAVADGVVKISRWYFGYGNFIEILHRNDSGGIKTRYGHNVENLVKEGDQVKRGQIIGYIGSTGNSTEPHIHFELMIGDTFMDAGDYIRTAIQNGIKGDDLTIPRPDAESKKDTASEPKKKGTNNVP